MALKYHMCGSCKQEFFDDESFFRHPCVANGKRGVNDLDLNRMERQIKQLGGAKLLEGLTDPEAVRSVLRELQQSNDLNVANGENVELPKAEEVSPESVAKRIEAASDIKRMRHELKQAGIEANTLSFEETKAEYDAMKARQAQTAQAQKQTAQPKSSSRQSAKPSGAAANVAGGGTR